MGISIGAQKPFNVQKPDIENTVTQDEVDTVEFEGGTSTNLIMPRLTHRHYGHLEDHPIALRHRKNSLDPLHGEEDKLVDEFKELFDKAKKGECNPVEMGRLQSIQGRLSEIQASRQEDARRLLAEEFEDNNPSSLKLSKSLDAVLLSTAVDSKLNKALPIVQNDAQDVSPSVPVNSSVSKFKGSGLIDQKPIS